ncbi:MAG: hypothetical protein QOD50_1210 [Actinomycetota bacterium]|jgi:uncharacterized protein YndB with AHSA1/START domain|nr:hypothetical protein [Actinomycetota bacterium]
MSNPTTITANPGEQVVDIERVINAPVADVYRAYTQPELIAQWMGPRGYEMEIDTFDVRDGGSWRFVHITPEGGKFGFHGSYHSVVPQTSMVQTFEFEGAPGHVSLERVTFEGEGDTTRVRVHAVYQTVEDRDAMIDSGMVHGVTEGYERLDELLVRS